MAEREGVVRYRLDYQPGTPPDWHVIDPVNAWRRVLHHLELVGGGLAGRYGGLGFGNVSARLPEGGGSFAVSGTQTGHIQELGAQHYCVVIRCDAEHNTIVARGPIRPSSEALTHGALYDADPAIQCVLHVHSPDIWERADVLDLPSTRQNVEYGTPEMAVEVGTLVSEAARRGVPVIAMAGHQDGVLAFGRTADEAGLAVVRILALSYRHSARSSLSGDG